MIIPFFIPHAGCPHQCVFCNQKSITGVAKPADRTSLSRTINKYLETKGKKTGLASVAFYGGSFTALPHDIQRSYLSAVAPFLKSGRIKSIRLSTRPDAIDSAILDLLREYQVDIVELGVQSMNDQVLARSGRGHTASDTVTAVAMLRQRGFRIGLQLMPGLPGDGREAFAATVNETIALKPEFVRIYPTLVIRDTPLAEDYRTGRYQPLTLDQAVALCKTALTAYRAADIEVIRIGLQATDELEKTSTIIAGPYHPAFRQLVESSLLMDRMQEAVRTNNAARRFIFLVHPVDLSFAIGQKRSNMETLRKQHPEKKIEVSLDRAVVRGNIKLIVE
jgi:histone acetyltransferase (RNA polymerase elongator complex component)